MRIPETKGCKLIENGIFRSVAMQNNHFLISGQVTLTKELLESRNTHVDIKKIQCSVPKIVAIGNNGERELNGLLSRGTGFVISPDGFLLTNYHVANNPWNEKLYAVFTSLPDITFPKIEQSSKLNNAISQTDSFSRNTDIEIFSVPLVTIYSSEKHDLALLAIEALESEDSWTQLSIANNKAENGEVVFTIGYPDRKRECVLTSGEILLNSFTPFNFLVRDDEQSIEGIYAKPYVISTVKTVNGNSGGPLLRNNGDVCGVVCGSISQGGFIVKLNWLFKRLLRNPLTTVKKLPYTFASELSTTLGMEDIVFPFLKEAGVSEPDFREGKPLRHSDIVAKKYNRITSK